MLKAKADNLIILGITDENIKRLKKGQPISVDLDEIDAKCACNELIIFYARDEDELVQAVQPHITNKTKIHEAK